MIVDAILNVILAIPTLLLDFMGELSIEIPSGIISWLDSMVYCLAYLLPISTILVIIVVEFSLMGFHIAWAIILRIKGFIPTMGA